MSAFQDAHESLGPLNARELDELIAIAAVRRDRLRELDERERDEVEPELSQAA